MKSNAHCFNSHKDYEGLHAFLSPSNYHWLRYSDDKLVQTFQNFFAAQKGTKLHSIAKDLIDEGIYLPRKKKTLNLYVNDGIAYKMTTEQPLVYSPRCFGTADAISIRNGKLRIHDLKTGSTPAHMEQLIIYASIFFLEYEQYDPKHTEIELRIYQNDEVMCFNPDVKEDILPTMEKIIHFDKILETYEMEE